MTNRSAMRVLMTLTLFFGVTSPVSADPQTEAKSQDASAERLKFMKDSVRIYELTLGDGRATALSLQREAGVPPGQASMRRGSARRSKAIFLWTGEYGRPSAAIQVFLIKNANEPQGLWIHEFTSLAPTTLKAVRSGQSWWAPSTPGLEFKPLPDAPKPAESPAQRARQMRASAEGFPGRLRITSAARAGQNSGCSPRRSPGTANQGQSWPTGPFSPSCSAPTLRSSCCSRRGPASKDFNGSMLLRP